MKSNINRYVPVSNKAIKSILAMPKNKEYKLLMLILTQIDDGRKGEDVIISLNKHEAMEILGRKYNKYKASPFIRGELKNFAKDVMVEISYDDENWEDCPVITQRKSEYGSITVKLEKEAVDRFFRGFHERGDTYTRLWVNDIYAFKSLQTTRLYIDLLFHADRRKKIQEWVYTTRQLKDLFGLSKEDYTCSINGRTELQRDVFEKRCVSKALEEIQEKAEKMEFVKSAKGLLFEKIYECGRVKGYKIRYHLPKYFNLKEKESVNDEKCDSITTVVKELFGDKFNENQVKALSDVIRSAPDEVVLKENESLKKYLSIKNSVMDARNVSEKGRYGYLTKIIENEITDWKKDNCVSKENRMEELHRKFGFEHHDYDLKELARRAKSD